MQQKEKLYIVTGAFGHLGSTIVKTLLEQGKRVRCLVLEHEKPCMDISVFNNVEMVVGDVTKKETLLPLFYGEDEKVLIHTAGIISIEGKISPLMRNVNINGTRNVIELCSENKTKMIYISSVHAIPAKKKHQSMTEINSFDPNTVKGGYAKTKAIATQMVLDAVNEGKLNAVVVHPSGIIGPYDCGKNHMVSMISDFLTGNLRAVVKGGYDMVDVRDVANAAINATEEGKNGNTYILSGVYCPLTTLVDKLHNITKIKKIKTVLPMWFAWVFVPLCELYYKIRGVRPLYTAYSLSVIVSNSNFDNTKAKNELGFNPRSLDETLTDTVDWLVNHCKVPLNVKLLNE